MIFKIFGRRKAEAASDTPAQTHQPTQPPSSEPAAGQGARRRRGRSGTAVASNGEGNMPNSHHSGHSTADKRHGQHKPSGHNKTPPAIAWDPAQFTVEPLPGRTRFHDFDLPDTLMRGIAELGFSYCTPIQARSLPESLRGQDVVGKAQTGTGKTAAFLITLINDMLRHPVKESRYAGEARAIILAPTRELAMQIGEDAKNLSRYCGLHVHTLVGGMDYGKQKERLHGKLVDILVATPGRLIDFLESRDVYLDEVEFLVIDEADRMLDMGFIPQVKRIVRCTPQKMNRQTLLFSATFTHDVLSLADQWTHNAVHIEIEPERVAADAVEQKIYAVSESEKLLVLYNLLQDPAVESVLVFANRRDITHWVYDSLVAMGTKCGILAGDVAQNRRISTLENFREGKIRVLVATDVAGRGIHISGITHVINYNLPEEPEDYVHRIGRTGRAGAKGVSISFASEDDAFQLPALEKLLGRKFECEQPPEAFFTPLPAGVKVPSAAPRPRPQRPGMGGGRGGGYRGGRR